MTENNEMLGTALLGDATGMGALFERARELAHPIEIVLFNPQPDDTGRVPGEVKVAFDPGRGKVIADPKLIEQYALWPREIQAAVVAEDLASFIDMVNRHKLSGRSVLFYTLGDGAPSITALLDYHRPTEGDEQGRAGNVKHRVTYRFPLSEQWRAWTGKDTKPMTQEIFAEFIEDHIGDILPVHDRADWDPESLEAELARKLGATYGSPQEILQLSKGLKVIVAENFEAKVNLQTGEMTWAAHEQHGHVNNEGGKIKLPELFLIGIPVFAHGGRAYRVPVRLRYRKKGQEWHYALYRAVEDVFEPAVENAAREAAEATELPLYRGRPSAS